MKLKKVLSICKTNGLYYLYDRIDRSGEITQWLGDASALYPLDGLPILDEESFCAVFNITGKQREKILFRHERLPEHLNVEDVAAGDKLVREYETTFINGGLRLKPLKTNNGVMFIRSLYLSPLEDVIDMVQFYERTTPQGGSYIVAKAGFLTAAVIMPYVISKKFADELEELSYCTNHRYNKQAARTAMIRAAADKNPPVYGFDCVCLIKGVLWGWNGNAAKPYGGAVYASNGVPDSGADTMITKCSGVSADFSGIVPGEAVWLPGHIGVYIGGGKVIECSPAFKNCVQVTACLNIGAISGMNGRKWTKHGKLPYITYDTAGGAQDGAGSTTTPSGTTTTPATLAFAVGDVVRFTGNTHYTNAAAASGAACKPGTAKVTALAKGAKHPYHLIKQPGGGSTVYGWVNAADVQAVGSGTTAPKMRVGAKVKYSGPLYRDSNGGGQGKTVNGTYTVKYYYPGRKCGVHIDGLGWGPESGCTVIG